jgi:hypothetical protein
MRKTITSGLIEPDKPQSNPKIHIFRDLFSFSLLRKSKFSHTKIVAPER